MVFRAAPPIADTTPPPEPEQAPKRKRRADAGRPRGPRGARTRGSLEDAIAGSIMAWNMPLVAFLPGDALSMAEISALAKGMDQQASVNSAFRRYVEAFIATTTGGALVGAVGAIAARRLSRHNIILPDVLDPMIGATLAQQTGQSDEPIALTMQRQMAEAMEAAPAPVTS